MGFYIGPALEHCRCFKCYVPATGVIRISDTVKFFPHQEQFPPTTTKDQFFFFLQALHNIIFLPKNKNQDLAFLVFGDATKNTLETLSTLLHRTLQPQLPNPVLPKTKSVLSWDPKITSSPKPNIIEPDTHNFSQPLQQKTMYPKQLTRMQIPTKSPKLMDTPNLFSSPAVQHIYNEPTGVRETMDTLLNGNTM